MTATIDPNAGVMTLVNAFTVDEVAKSCDEYAADPSIGIPVDDIMARLRASYRARQTKSES